jgi:hypothetical protein
VYVGEEEAEEDGPLVAEAGGEATQPGELTQFLLVICIYALFVKKKKNIFFVCPL